MTPAETLPAAREREEAARLAAEELCLQANTLQHRADDARAVSDEAYAEWIAAIQATRLAEKPHE